MGLITMSVPLVGASMALHRTTTRSRRFDPCFPAAGPAKTRRKQGPERGFLHPAGFRGKKASILAHSRGSGTAKGEDGKGGGKRFQEDGKGSTGRKRKG